MSPRAGDYRLFFDLAQAGYRDWWFPALGLLFVVIGLFGVLYQRGSIGMMPHPSRRLALGSWAVLVSAVSWTVLVAIVTYREYKSLLDAVEKGQATYLEGPVEEFSPMPANGHGSEHFAVRGKRFEYSDNVVTAGFNTTSTHGGPIRAGVEVKVGYVGDTIVHLEWRAIAR